jgi:hypothetical protein
MGTSSANGSSSTASAHSGSRAIRISGAGAGVRAQDVTAKLSAGQTYRISAWTRTSSPGGGDRRVGVTFYKSGKQVATFYRGFRSTAWAPTDWAFVSPPSFDRAVAWVSRKGDGSTFYVDDLTLRSIPNGIVLDSSDSGTAASPVVVASYGTGRATIDPRDGIGFWGGNVAGVRVQNLIFSGSWDAGTGRGGNAGSGIEFANTLAGDTKLEFVTVEKCEAKGFRWAGVRVTGWNGKSGFRTVYVTDTKTHHNGDAGILVGGQFDRASTSYANEKVYVARCLAYDNNGIPDKGGNSGSGIQLCDTLNGTVERCVARDNGRLNNYAQGGPVGIWAYDASKITLQYNESHHNRTGSGMDGAGFDLDGGVMKSVVQNNYSHDNDGPGFLLCQFAGARPWGGNTVRYNISQNDARRNSYGAVSLTGGPGPANAVVEHNTLYIKPSTTGGTVSGVRIKYAQTGVHVRNNIIVTTGGVAVVDVDTAGVAARFNGNRYHASGASLKFRWSGASYSTLSGWRSATGRETSGGVATGSTGDPKLASAGNAPTLNDAQKLASLWQYKLASTSPALDACCVLASPFSGYTSATYDFFARALPATKRDLGASEGT